MLSSYPQSSGDATAGAARGGHLAERVFRHHQVRGRSQTGGRIRLHVSTRHVSYCLVSGTFCVMFFLVVDSGLSSTIVFVRGLASYEMLTRPLERKTRLTGSST